MGALAVLSMAILVIQPGIDTAAMAAVFAVMTGGLKWLEARGLLPGSCPMPEEQKHPRPTHAMASREEPEARLRALLSELERLSCACYVASRATKIVGANWSDKTPLPFTVGYLTVVPATKALSEIWVPRRLS